MQYRANPVIVDAFKIVSVKEKPCGLSVTTEDGKEREGHHDDLFARYAPVAGDYWVIQEDGYEYVNPKAVFERKYSQVNK